VDRPPATQDGHPFKLRATLAFADRLEGIPEASGYADILYEERDGVGYLHFPSTTRR
jgi:hypothetical protein